MLVDNAAPQRLEGHIEDVPSDAEYQHHRQGAGEPGSDVSQISLQIEVEQRERHDDEA